MEKIMAINQDHLGVLMTVVDVCQASDATLRLLSTLTAAPWGGGLAAQTKRPPRLRDSNSQPARIGTQNGFQSLSFSTKGKMFVSGHGRLVCFIIRTDWKGFPAASRKASQVRGPDLQTCECFSL